MTSLTVLMDPALVRETTIISPPLGLVLLVPSQEYRVLLVLPYGIPFLLVHLQ